MHFPLSLLLFVLFSIVPAPGDARSTQPVDDRARLRSNILALDRVQRNIYHSLEERKAVKNISNREQRELLIFVDYLQERTREYCGQLEKRSGRAALVDLPCPEEPVRLPEVKAKTTDEELADLDHQLDASLGEFDEMLLKEQERIAAHQPRQRESGASSSGGAGGDDGQQGGKGNIAAAGATEGGATGGKEQGQSSGITGQGKNGRATTAGATASGRQGQAGSENVKGSCGDKLHADDDIVARQLREAAEKETDPELKEKLWQEYRKYKEGL